MGSLDRDTEEGAFLCLSEFALLHWWKSAVVTENVGLHWQLKSELFTQCLSCFVSEVYSWMFD